MRAVCLKHVAFEGPGTLANALTGRGVSLERYLVPQDGLPRPRQSLNRDGRADVCSLSVGGTGKWMKIWAHFGRKITLSGTVTSATCL